MTVQLCPCRENYAIHDCMRKVFRKESFKLLGLGYVRAYARVRVCAPIYSSTVSGCCAGSALVKSVFSVKDNHKKKRWVAGCVCELGELKKADCFRVLRLDQEVYSGKLPLWRKSLPFQPARCYAMPSNRCFRATSIIIVTPQRQIYTPWCPLHNHCDTFSKSPITLVEIDMYVNKSEATCTCSDCF